MGQADIQLGRQITWLSLREKGVTYPTPLIRETEGQFFARQGANPQRQYVKWCPVDEGAKYDDLPTLAELTTTVLTKG